jgi:hypothetical protein
MSDEQSTLYAKLLGETASISWKELQPFFARGALLRVAGDFDLIEAAQAVALDDREKVAAWLAKGYIGKLEADEAQDWLNRDPDLWAVVVAPWVLVQERAAQRSVPPIDAVDQG